MNESLLKKEFKKKDIQRVRNLVNKDYTSSTTTQTGYQKVSERHSEGDVWEDGDKTWTIKNGLRQNITKLDSIKKAARIPLVCPNCGGSMKHWLAKKMYKIHGFCFDPCTVEYETSLKAAGLYEQYEKRMMSGNIKAFIQDVEGWVLSSLEDQSTYVTEQGDVESWNKIGNKYKEKVLEDLNKYISILKEHT